LFGTGRFETKPVIVFLPLAMLALRVVLYNEGATSPVIPGTKSRAHYSHICFTVWTDRKRDKPPSVCSDTSFLPLLE